jgi:hypothetical protein
MSMTDDLMGMANEAREANAKEEYREMEIQQEDEEWEEDDFDDEPIRTPIDGLCVDTRDWKYARASDILNMNLPHARKIVLTSAAGNLRYNRFLSASNFRNRRGN